MNWELLSSLSAAGWTFVSHLQGRGSHWSLLAHAVVVGLSYLSCA